MAVSLDFKLLDWQKKLLQNPTRFKVVVAGRRCGKSRFAIVSTILKGLECPDKTGSVIYIAPTQQLARVLAWSLLMQLGHPVIASSNIANSEIKLVNGVTIFVRGADNPDSLRGMKLYYAVLDESKDFKDDVWPLIIRPALSDMKGGALIIGTPEPGESQFREQFDYGLAGEDKDWMSLHLTTYDNELIDPAEIEAAKRSMSTMAFQQEFMADFDTMTSDIFKKEWFKYGPEPKVGEYYITVDLAGFTDVSDPSKKRNLDETAIAVVKVTDDGKWWVKKVDGFRKDVRETAVRIMMAMRTYKPVMVGIENGALMRAVMPYLTDLMRKNSIYIHIEPISTSGGSKKGSDVIANRVIYNLQGRFEHGRIVFSEGEDHGELEKQILIFPSKKAHDDRIDALSLIANIHQTIYGDPNDHQEEREVFDEVCGF